MLHVSFYSCTKRQCGSIDKEWKGLSVQSEGVMANYESNHGCHNSLVTVGTRKGLSNTALVATFEKGGQGQLICRKHQENIHKFTRVMRRTLVLQF